MSTSKTFSGPPANKATAATLAAAVATLFWTIAAHTFWKTMSTSDMTLYITTSTVFLTAIVGFLVPESAAYTSYNQQRLAGQASTQPSAQVSIPAISALRPFDEQLQTMQELQTAIAVRLGVTAAPVVRS